MDLSDVLAIVGAATGITGAFTGWSALRIARRADERDEAQDRERRVKFEFRYKGDDRYALVNVGTEVAKSVKLDSDSVVGVAVEGPVVILTCKPGKEWAYTVTAGRSGRIPETIRVTWTHPFSGEQYVALPVAEL